MIIAITGRKGAGKSTAAAYIEDKYGYEEYALARPMKDALAVMFGYGHAELYGDRKETIDHRYGITPRKMLQTLGTEWGQFVLREASEEFRVVTDRDIWIKRFYYMVWNPEKNYVISDVRFQHELEGLAHVDDMRSVMLVGRGEEDDHSSEAGGMLADVVIDNSGSPEELYSMLDTLMGSLRE